MLKIKDNVCGGDRMSEKSGFWEDNGENGACVSCIADRGDIARYLVRGRRQSKGWLCDAEDVAASGDFFEVLLALTELCCTERLCIAEPLPWRCGKGEFEERAEALFRSAVYGGELSVMLYGYRSACEVEDAFELMHKSFCRLEEQGREVSGYLARGVLIDSPIALFEMQSLPKTDFICLDFDRLCESLLGYRADVIANDGTLVNTLCGFWEDRKHACFLHRRTELRALSKRLYQSELFFDWAKFMEIREIYIPKQSAEQKNT